MEKRDELKTAATPNEKPEGCAPGVEGCMNCKYADCIYSGPAVAGEIPHDCAKKMERKLATEEGRNEYYRQRYWRRRNSGMCTSCGKRPPVQGHVLCSECIERKLARRREKEKLAAQNAASQEK